jgi:hypothetical protein
MNQLLIQTDTAYDAWKPEFDADSETMANAGLSTLQIWKTDSGVAVLLKLADRKRAEDWLNRQSGLGHSYTAQFLQTA